MRSHFRLFSFTVAVTGLALTGLALFSSVPTSALIASVAPAASAGAASGSTVSMLGFWNSHAYITDWGPTFPADKPPGGPYPNPTTITSYDPATGAFSGIDDAWGVGRENITGTLHKDGAVTYTIVDPGNVLHGTGTVTFDAETTTATWKGTWSNSIGEHGTSYGTWKGFRISGTVRLGCSFCSATPALPVVGVDVGVHGSYSLSNTLTTDSDGRFKDVLPSGSYSVTPDVAGWTFTPASLRSPPTAPQSKPISTGAPRPGHVSGRYVVHDHWPAVHDAASRFQKVFQPLRCHLRLFREEHPPSLGCERRDLRGWPGRHSGLPDDPPRKSPLNTTGSSQPA